MTAESQNLEACPHNIKPKTGKEIGYKEKSIVIANQGV